MSTGDQASGITYEDKIRYQRYTSLLEQQVPRDYELPWKDGFQLPDHIECRCSSAGCQRKARVHRYYENKREAVCLQCCLARDMDKALEKHLNKKAASTTEDGKGWDFIRGIISSARAAGKGLHKEEIKGEQW